MKKMYHKPVLLQESVDGLAIKEDGVYVDVTFGGGGHSREILKRLGDQGRLFAFDQDEEALQNNMEDDRFVLINENFRFLKRFLKFYGIKKVDGVLGDFGVSSHQFDEADRGFSIRFEGQLDMRMSAKNAKSAYHVVNEYDEADLRRLFREYGELKNAYKLASAIATARLKAPIDSTAKLNESVQHLLPRHREQKTLAQMYQALRIEVNEEMLVLKEFLMQTPELIKTGGRLSLISYHSLEDRLVKRFMRAGAFEGEADKDFYGNLLVPFKKVGKLIVPSQEEISNNNRARSARLRIAERI